MKYFGQGVRRSEEVGRGSGNDSRPESSCIPAGIVARKWGAYWLTPQCTPECLFLSKLKEEKRGEGGIGEHRRGEEERGEERRGEHRRKGRVSFMH